MRRRSAANQQAAGVSLFPFLAVLLCTMGALIVVLVVIARHAHLQVAEAARRAAAEAAKGDLAIKREDLEWRISELTKSRAATKKMLDEKQLELSHLEEHTRRIRDKLEELAAAKAHFHELAAGDAKENGELKARLTRLRTDVKRTKAQIDDLRAKAGPGGDSYAIIPYHGPNETHRRPIYVECRKEGVVLQPEGIVLTEDDFVVDAGTSNPLVSALRAARDYHARNQLLHRSEATTPYPLFIIRPDGIEMSYKARAAMISWGPEFGYELIGQDWPLEYPPPEPMLALAMKQAVSEGRMRQAYIARAAPMLSRSSGHATFRASAHGGITQVDGSPGGSGRRSSGRPRGVAGRRGIGGGGQLGGGQSSGRSGSFLDSDSGDGPVHSVDGNDNPYESALASSSPGGRYGRGGISLADSSSGQPGGRYPGRSDGGFLPDGGSSHQTAGPNPNAFGSPYGLGHGRYGNTVNGQGSSGNGPLPGGGSGNGNRAGGIGNAIADVSGKGSGSEGAGTGGAAGDGKGNGKAAGGTQLAKAEPAKGAGGGISGYPSGRGLSNGAAAGTGRGGVGQGKEPAGGIFGGTNKGAPGINGGRNPGGATIASGTPGGNAFAGGNSASSEPGSPGATGNAGGTVGKIPSNTGATAPGGAYRMAASGANSKAASGPGNSDPTGDAAGSTSTNGPDAPASPNGFASGRVVNDGQPTAQAGSSKRGGGGTAEAGSESPTVLSESRGAAGGTAGGTAANGSRSKTRGQVAGGASAGASGSSSSRSSMPSGQSSGLGGSASSMQSSQAGGLPMPNMSFGQQHPQAPESIAKKRDHNWANPDASTSSIPIERPIRIVCDAEHLTLLPEGRGRQGMRVIPFKRQTVESVDDLVSTVWDRIDSWGTAGRGMYWRPVLLMEVEPGGQRRYAELQALLADSGFDVHGKPRRHFFIAPRTVNARQQ